MKIDSYAASLMWGRIGAAVLAAASVGFQLFGINFSEEDQKQANDAISWILASASGILSLVSKIREQKRAK